MNISYKNGTLSQGTSKKLFDFDKKNFFLRFEKWLFNNNFSHINIILL